MTRPSRNTDKLLIQAARELLPQCGCSGLSLREVASRAGVNLGMFHYHFKTKEQFTRRVLDEVYEEFFKEFSVVTRDGEKNPLQALTRGLENLGRFARDNRALVAALLRDVLAGNKETMRFAAENFGRHAKVIYGLVVRCQNEGQLRKGPPVRLLMAVASATAFPSLAAVLVERVSAGRPWRRQVAEVLSPVLSDEAIAERVENALKGWRR